MKGNAARCPPIFDGLAARVDRVGQTQPGDRDHDDSAKATSDYESEYHAFHANEQLRASEKRSLHLEGVLTLSKDPSASFLRPAVNTVPPDGAAPRGLGPRNDDGRAAAGDPSQGSVGGIGRAPITG